MTRQLLYTHIYACTRVHVYAYAHINTHNKQCVRMCFIDRCVSFHLQRMKLAKNSIYYRKFNLLAFDCKDKSKSCTCLYKRCI